MNPSEFFERVVPHEGIYYVGSLSGNGKVKRFNQKPVDNFADIIPRADELTSQRKEVFYSTSAYNNTTNRKVENIKSKKSLYIDLDCGEGKGFATKQDALNELKKFLRLTGMQFPTIIVDSGNGYHVYWVFPEAITAAEWTELALALKSKCAEFGFKIDGGVTQDASRILRVPGSLNYKDPANPVPCKIIKAKDEDVDMDAMRKCLERIAPPPLTLVHNANAAPVDNNALGTPPDYSGKKWYTQGIIEDCPTMEHLWDTQGKDASYALWLASLQVLAFTEDGEDHIYDISSGHPDYAELETSFKFKEAQTMHGPATCEHMKSIPGNQCANCPHTLKSPISLGKPPATELPYPYVMAQSGVFRTEPDTGELIPVTSYQIYDFMMGLNEVNQLVVTFTCHNGKSPPKNIEVLTSTFTDTRTFAGALSAQNLILGDSEVKGVKQLMTHWAKQVEAAKQVSTTPAVLGWTKQRDKLGFVLADQSVWEDGTGGRVATGSNPIIEQYVPTGDMAKWRKAADIIINHSCIESQILLASAFAAPLIKFAGTSGTMLSIVSAASGVGKTSAMRTAQAVWGNPKRGINALNDTALSVSKRLGKLNNLPAYWDELHMRQDIESFTKLVFQLAQGKEKARLRADTSFQDVGTWETIITVASNESIVDHIQATIKGTDAGLMRVLELDIDNAPKSTIPLADAMKIFGALDHNYGHAGIEYAFYLTRNHKQVRAHVTKAIESIAGIKHMQQSERMRISLIAALIVGAACANKAGLTNFDINGIKKRLLSVVMPKVDHTGALMSTQDSPVDMLRSYIDENAEHQLTIESMPAKGGFGGGGGVVVIQEPKRLPVRVTVGSVDGFIRIEKRDFREWVTRNYGAGTRHIRTLRGTPGVTETKSSLSYGLKSNIAGERRDLLQVHHDLLK